MFFALCESRERKFGPKHKFVVTNLKNMHLWATRLCEFFLYSWEHFVKKEQILKICQP